MCCLALRFFLGEYVTQSKSFSESLGSVTGIPFGLGPVGRVSSFSLSIWHGSGLCVDMRFVSSRSNCGCPSQTVSGSEDEGTNRVRNERVLSSQQLPEDEKSVSLRPWEEVGRGNPTKNPNTKERQHLISRGARISRRRPGSMRGGTSASSLSSGKLISTRPNNSSRGNKEARLAGRPSS